MLPKRPVRPITTLFTAQAQARRKHHAPRARTIVRRGPLAALVAALRRAALLVVGQLATRTSRRKHGVRGQIRALASRVRQITRIAAFRGRVAARPRLSGVLGSHPRLAGALGARPRLTERPAIQSRLVGELGARPRLTGVLVVRPTDTT
jgi:hypothetical protein